MENPRFMNGELETHFIDRETSLFDDLRTIMVREKPIQERLSRQLSEKKKIAAIAAVAAVTQKFAEHSGG